MYRSSVFRAAAVGAAVALSLLSAGSALASYRINWNALSAISSGVWVPDQPPEGADLSSCRPSLPGRDPVILVHGTMGNQNDSWQGIAPFLANQGFCVYSLTYGGEWYSGGLGGIGDIYRSAAELGSFVIRVRAATGAAQVDIVGHSEGGMLARVAMKYDGLAPNVHRLVGIGPDNAVPSFSGLVRVIKQFPGGWEVVSAGCPACDQQESQSFFDALNAGGETYPGVQYTTIASTHDEVITPVSVASLPPAPNVTNATVQSLCPHDKVGHLGLIYDPDVGQMVANALDPAHAITVKCTTGLGL